ncbi:MAG: adenosylcobinamide-GDP ribazoletransferase, partial [Gemmatimonadaceae bacterium]|nr:adenosylcobinamide-GDP ribazoletransferase [Gemmatimonadaceae bacterium]
IATGRDVWLTARALVVAHMLGRWSSLPLIHWLPYVRDDGTGKPFAAAVTAARLLVASAFTVAVAVLVLAPVGGPAIGGTLVSAVVCTALAGRYFRRHLGGMTGDCLGAANQLVEIVTYLVLAARWPVS